MTPHSPLLVHVAIEWPLKWNKECSFRNDAHYVIYELGTGRDPHQLLLNTSHFLPLSLEKLLSYAGAPLTHTITEKKWNSCPQFLACRRASMFRDRLSSKKNCTYIPLPCTMYLYCNIYVPTYLSFDSLHNEAKSCLKLYCNKNANDFMRYFYTFNRQHIKKKKMWD